MGIINPMALFLRRAPLGVMLDSGDLRRCHVPFGYRPTSGLPC
jgi:hypothetical protein